jgi:hypothetical protein
LASPTIHARHQRTLIHVHLACRAGETLAAGTGEGVRVAGTETAVLARCAQAVVNSDATVVPFPARLTVTCVMRAHVTTGAVVPARDTATHVHNNFAQWPSVALITLTSKATSKPRAQSVVVTRIGTANI